MTDLVGIRIGVTCQLEGLALDGFQVTATNYAVFGSICTAQASRIGHFLKGNKGEHLFLILLAKLMTKKISLLIGVRN